MSGAVLEDPIECKNQGNEAFNRGDYDDALDLYTCAIKLGEKHKELPVFYKNRAAVHLKMENYELAEKDCNKALEITPKDPKALYRRCQALEALGRFEEAYRDARAIWDNDPNNKTIQPVLERLHAITQERAKENAQTSTKVQKMFEILFNFDAQQDLSKKKTAAANCVVLSRERAGAEAMFKEGFLQKANKLIKVEKEPEIVLNLVRAVDHLCVKSVERTKAALETMGVPWFLKMLNTEAEDQVSAAQHLMQTVLNSFSGLENKEDSKPIKELVEEHKKDIDMLLTCLVYATTDPVITGRARDAIMELLTRNIHWKYLDWADRLVEIKGLLRIMQVCSELEEYSYESAIPITSSSRTIAGVLLARIYENMYYDAAKQRFGDQIADFVKEKLLAPDIESKVRVTVAMTTLLQGPLDAGNAIISREGILQMILAMATTDDPLQQKVACECMIAAASKKDKAKALVTFGVDILKKLYHSKDEGLKVRALVGLCKLGSSGGLDATIRPLADGSTKKLAEACRRFLIKPGKDKDIRKWAAEGLSYLTLDADVKEKLIEDRPAIRALIELAKTGDQSCIYGVTTTLVNLCNAYEKMEILPELKQLAEFAKHHIPEEHELDDADFVSKRVCILCSEGVTSGLVALCKTESENSREMIARVFNALCMEQSNRGTVVQQGGAKALIPLALDGTANGKRHAGQALSRIGITINPEVAFPGQRALEVIRPLINQLHPDCTALENFEAMMALTNLAAMSETVRKRILREQGLIRVESYLGEEHEMLNRAAMQVICNMCMSDDVVRLFEGKNERIKMLTLFCEAEDEETAKAAAGALAIVTDASEKCCEKVFDAKLWLDALHCLVANPSPDVQHRGIVVIRNMLKANRKIAQRILETDILELLSGLSQWNDERRAKAIDTARECLQIAEEYKIIQEREEEDMMPDVFKQKARIATNGDADDLE